MTLGRLGKFEEAFDSLRRALETADEVGNLALYADLHLWTAWTYLDKGDAQTALRYAERGLNEAITANSFECICHGFACVGYGKLQSQKLAEAAEAFQEAIQRSRQSGAEYVEKMGRAGLALSRFYEGQTEVVGEVEAALEEARAAEAGGEIALFSEALGQIYAALGQREIAERHLESAINFYKALGMRPYWERVEVVLAEVRVPERVHEKQGSTPAT
jgi:tetratricopeptide (TPR) repeat protein